MNNNTMQNKKRKGFTLFEMLIVVAIMVALFAVSAVSVNSIQKSIRQKKLDYCAELIYMAAQNQITELCVAGEGNSYLYYQWDANTQDYIYKDGEKTLNPDCDAEPMGTLPSDAAEPKAYTDGGEPYPNENTYYYVCSWSAAEGEAEINTAKTLVPEGLIDESIRSGNWVIEYDPDNAYIYGVFYSEGDRATDYSPTNANFQAGLRYREGRVDDGSQIGYYGGENDQVPEYKPNVPEVQVYNGEVLAAVITCRTVDGTGLSYEVSVCKGTQENAVDEDGNVTVETSNAITPAVTRVGNVYVSTVILDSVENPFYENFKTGAAPDPGSDITVIVTSKSSNLLVEDKTTSACYLSGTEKQPINSLFDSVAGDTAYIACGRHLQNLDKNSSFVSDSIKKAVQTNDISFLDDGITETNSYEEDWYGIYGDTCFTPITNSNLVSYSGKFNDGSFTIYGLTTLADRNNDSGLFRTIKKTDSGMTISNVTLSGTHIRRGKNVGALVGNVEKNAKLTIENCYVILDNKTDTRNISADSFFINGSVAGGLVGYAQSGSSVTIEYSCAATIIGPANSSAAGGLVGRADGAVSISASYADCYLYGNYTGGLVGMTSGSGAVTLADCYAAGYQMAKYAAAGLCYGTLKEANRVYTVCTYLNSTTGSTTITRDDTYKCYTTAREMQAGETVFFLYKDAADEECNISLANTNVLEGENTPITEDALTSGIILEYLNDGVKSTDTVFIAKPSLGTVTYNLLDQGLTSYSYPSIKNMAHYGDWKASFQSGTLVYYEVYNDGTKGFYGANMNTLKSDDDLLVVGDGYGIVYDKTAYDKLAVGEKLQIKYNEKTTDFALKPSAGYEPSLAVTVENETYYILPLDTSISDSTTASKDFWQPISVGVAGSNETKYYFNPHFPMCLASGDSDQVPDAPNVLNIRSARHLFNLSLYYPTYRSTKVSYEIFQAMNIDYEQYKWAEYSSAITTANKNAGFVTEKTVGGQLVALVTAQSPIGSDEDKTFKDTYEGNYCYITNVSFYSTVDSVYTGMFGYNEGSLRNIIIQDDTTDNGQDSRVGFRGKLYTKKYPGYYAGVLVGMNTGIVSNCAAAGYEVVANAYQNSTVYVGGLVGGNRGSISGSSAVCPIVELTAFNSDVSVGGFVGRNDGSVSSCYCAAAIKVVENTLQNEIHYVNLAGFCAVNTVLIQNSYCTTTLTGAGETTVYGFTPKGATSDLCQNCYYLNFCNVRFMGDLYTVTYETNPSDSDGEALTLSEFADLSLSGMLRVGTKSMRHYYDDKNSHYDEADKELVVFPSGVRDADGNAVHYGDWFTSAVSDKADVFYWEKEVSEDGKISYHISNGPDDSNLCTDHDDGGVITEYGYGYYAEQALEDNNKVSFSISGFTESVKALNKNRCTEAETQLNKLNGGIYAFHCYYTGSTAGTTDKALYLSGDVREGTWTLEITVGSTTTKYEYYVNPFFANAITRKSTTSDNAAEFIETMKPGDESRPYQIRCVEQLQYINWNYSTRNCSTDVTSDSYQQYPFLQYATETGEALQNKTSVENKRPVQYWKQSHDVGSDSVTDFWPIAGTSTGATDYTTTFTYAGRFNAVLYNWFGGSLDGQSYKIVNLRISSYLNNVGVFGYTCSADLQNIILYADDADAVIERKTYESRDKSVYFVAGSIYVPKNSTYSYAIGGLVGVAYDYYDGVDTNDNLVRDEKNRETIQNCAIAGYTIRDNSRNSRISCGDVNIGGLFGIANANITDCSAVVDIVVDCTFEYFSCIGNTVRAAGVAGCCPYTLTNCYSGGTISLGDNMKAAVNGTGTRAQLRTGYDVLGPLSETTYGNYYYTNVYTAGICAGNFGGSFMNFVNYGQNQSADQISVARKVYGQKIVQTLKNCYTYMEINVKTDVKSAMNNYTSKYKPFLITYKVDASINIMDPMAIGGVPEREAGKPDREDYYDDYYKEYDDDSYEEALEYWLFNSTTGHSTATNCWYLEGQLGGLQGKSTGYIIGQRYTAASDASKNDVIADCGAFDINGKTIIDGKTDGETIFQKLEEAGFKEVTRVEDLTGTQQKVDGKYSFPGNNKTLLGSNYPFPCIITQTNFFDETVYVHYGEWPTGQIWWDEYYVNHDVLTKTDQPVTLKLHLSGDAAALFKQNKNNLQISFENEVEEMPVVNAASLSVSDLSADGVVTITVDPIGTGVVKITAELGEYNPTCELTVSGNFTISVDPASYVGYVGETDNVTLSASYKDTNGDNIALDPKVISWKITIPEAFQNVVELWYSEDELADAEQALKNEYMAEHGVSAEEVPAFNEEEIRAKADKMYAAARSIGGSFGTALNLVGEGDAFLTVQATYNYGNFTLTSSATIAVESWSETVFGLADTSGDKPVYMEIRHSGAPESSYTAEKVKYENDAEAPKLEGSTLFLYAKGTGNSLSDYIADMTKTGELTITGPEGENTYYVEYGEVTTSNGWQILPITFNSVAGDFTVSFNTAKTVSYIADGSNQTTADAVSYSAELKLSRTEATTLNVTFEGLVDATLEEDGTLVGGEILERETATVTYGETISVPTEFEVPKGYHSGSDWKPSEPGTQAIYKDTTYQILLTADKYTLKLQPNGGTEPNGDPASEISYTIGYGELEMIPPLSFTAPTGKVFNGWKLLAVNSTDYSTAGISFIDAASLDDVLYAVELHDGDTITMEAVWVDQEQSGDQPGEQSLPTEQQSEEQSAEQPTEENINPVEEQIVEGVASEPMEGIAAWIRNEVQEFRQSKL